MVSAVQRDPIELYPNLFQIFGGYLHQDWDLDYESPEAALRDAADGQGPDQVDAAIEEIDGLLAGDLDPQETIKIVARLTPGYSPVRDGWEIRPWLVHARSILKSGLP